MGIMDKFATVEIKTDNRISDADKAFCLRQQTAFDKAGPALQKIVDMMIAAQTEQKEVLEAKEDDFYKTYLVCDGFDCDEHYVREAMKKRNRTFISVIVNYFAHKYNVKLDEHEIMEHLIPTGPKEPQLPWGGYRQMNDEEIDTYKQKLDAYEDENEKYEQSMRSLPLHYEQVVDEIFVQLGGFSFQERAINEFLSKCWNASHTKRWDEQQPREDFEVKNDTLRLTGNWCSCRNDSWRSYPEWKSADCLKVILNALVHFDIGQFNRGAEWFPELFKYYTAENVFQINNLRKIKNIKLFKNGRVDIKFRDAVTAQEFVESYLRRQVA